MTDGSPARREPIVAIDGPAGTGKSTVSARLARHFGFTLLDTGAIYRTLAVAAREEGSALDDEPALARLAAELPIAFVWDGSDNRVLLDGEDVSARIREPWVGNAASAVSALPAVRTALLGLQRRLGASGGVVAEGRDIGTVVFPDAEAKFFLTATAEERARRRVLQLAESGTTVSYEETLAAQRARDEADSNRAVAPLRQAADAVLVDSTALTLDEVVQTMIDTVSEVRARLHG